MKQPIPKIELQDIKRIIERDYSSYSEEVLLKALHQYKGDTIGGQFRVWAGILKVSDGDFEKLIRNIERAKFDFRDIIAEAEYPKFSKNIGFDEDKFTNDEINQNVENDGNQYQKWLKA